MKNKYIDGISIVIPTYNRKKQLSQQLNSIFNEDLSCIYEVIVLDNNSDYDIYEELNQYSNTNFRIVRNSFNVRMSTNIMNSFLHCKTKWMWILSDDDEICKGAIKIVHNNIKTNKHAGYIKFSTDGTGSVGLESKSEVKSLEEFIKYYSSDKLIRGGNAVFLSNGVFNLENLYPFLGYGFEFSYTYISFLIPVLLGLNKGIPVVFIDEKIVIYHIPKNGTWPFDEVALGLSTLSHVPLNLEKHYFKNLLNIFMIVKFKKLFIYLLKNKTKNAAMIYRLTHDNIYKLYLRRTKKLISYFLAILLNYPKTATFLFKKHLK